MTTDAFQGPNMANYLFHAQKIKTVYVLDDGGAFGVGIADSFQKRIGELGVKVLGRDRLDPKEADYKTILTKIKGMNPDAIYFGGVQQAGVKLARQAFEVMPTVHKLGSDGIYGVMTLDGAYLEALGHCGIGQVVEIGSNHGEGVASRLVAASIHHAQANSR